MVAHSKIAKYPFYRFRLGFWADFQNFVVVSEHRGPSITRPVQVQSYSWKGPGLQPFGLYRHACSVPPLVSTARRANWPVNFVFYRPSPPSLEGMLSVAA